MLAISGVHQWKTKNPVNHFVCVLKLTAAITDRLDEDIDQDGIIKVKIVDEISTDGCLKRAIEFTDFKWRWQLKINNHI